jgi:hypothetical protein
MHKNMYTRQQVSTVGWTAVILIVVGFVTPFHFLALLGVFAFTFWAGMSVREGIDNSIVRHPPPHYYPPDDD